jgi:uncharacterized protein (TIGR02996 family)
MGIEDAFLHDILAHPDDDAPRLIYADWLDEHNDPRGEFIRIQCALAQLSDEDPLRWPLEQREQELLREHEAKWLPKSIVGFGEYIFHRGFVEEITLRGQHFLKVANRLLEEAPIRYVRLSEQTRSYGGAAGTEGMIRRLVAHSPQLARLRGLSLAFHLDPEELRSLSESPYLDHLTDLGLHGLLLDQNQQEDALVALVESLLRPTLRSLDLTHSESRALSPFLRALARTPYLANLHRLNLANNSLAIDDLRILANSSSLTALRELTLNGNALTHAAATVLSEGLLLSQLETLHLDSNVLGDAGAVAIREWPALPRLSRLSLGHNHIFAAGMKALAEAAALRRLISLDLRGNIACDDGTSALASSQWTRLQSLNLWFNGVGDDGVRALAQSEALSHLTRLNLTANRVTSEGARALIESQRLPCLARLDLPRNDIAAAEQQRLCERFATVCWC